MSSVEELLNRLEVQPGGLVYLHTSFSRLRHLAETPRELLAGVLDYLGPDGTLVLPSFAWHLDPTQRPWKGYADYYHLRPPFDVRHTASNIGSVPECFRTWTGARRSADYWWSIAAVGPLASVLTDDQHLIEHPFGPGSSFHRLWRSGAHIVGLGVSLNTTSLAPVVDYVLGARHPQQVFSASPEAGVVIDAQGHEIVSRAFWLLPDVVRTIKPSEVLTRSDGLGGRLHRADEGDTIHFAYAFNDYMEHALDLSTGSVRHGTPVPWLEQLNS